jgi:alkylation response protein AidB-like acyl-CoA dehydrogenase
MFSVTLKKCVQSLGWRRVPIRRLTYDSYNEDVAGLSEELRELRQTVHAFAQRELAPRAHSIDQSNNFPMVLVQ